jgi:hypothetical protein
MQGEVGEKLILAWSERRTADVLRVYAKFGLGGSPFTRPADDLAAVRITLLYDWLLSRRYGVSQLDLLCHGTPISGKSSPAVRHRSNQQPQLSSATYSLAHRLYSFRRVGYLSTGVEQSSKQRISETLAPSTPPQGPPFGETSRSGSGVLVSSICSSLPVRHKVVFGKASELMILIYFNNGSYAILNKAEGSIVYSHCIGTYQMNVLNGKEEAWERTVMSVRGIIW